MDRTFNNTEFNKDVICERLAEINSMLSEECEKPSEEMDKKRVSELVYAQMIQGLKLNTIQSKPQNFYF